MLNCYYQLSSSVVFRQYGVSQSECKIDRPRPGLSRPSPRPHTKALGTRLPWILIGSITCHIWPTLAPVTSYILHANYFQSQMSKWRHWRHPFELQGGGFTTRERQYQPRSQALSSCGAKTLVGAGHVTHRKLIAEGGDGKVSYYMFPLPHFTLRLQGVAVLYNRLWESYILQNTC
jgi:hypothetical protein